MKITSFNPVIATAHCEDLVKLLRSSALKKDIIMKDANGFRVDIGDVKALPQDMMLIRMNVDNFEEAYNILIEHGFKNNRGDGTIDSKSSKSATMISPSGFTISIVQHIKDHD